jgi:chitin disaccharide deacetylase
LFLQRYAKIGKETGIPVMLPAGHMELLATHAVAYAPLRVMVQQLGKDLWNAGLPVLDDLHLGAFHGKPEEKKKQIIEFLHSTKPGVTQFIVHCTEKSDTFGAISGSGPMRFAELQAMMDPEVRKVVEDERIVLTTWRELKQRRENVQTKR